MVASSSSLPQHVDLQAATQRVMFENGFELAVPPGVARQLSDLERHPPPVAPGADVGDNLRVKLICTDLERGFVDFARA